MRIKTREDGETRRIEFDIEDGEVTQEYEVDGDKKELDADGDATVRQLLLEAKRLLRL